MTVNKSLLNFWSGVNYMKRDPSSNNLSFTIPAIGAIATYTVAHNLLKIPFYIVGYDLYGDGRLWTVNPVWIGMDQGSTNSLPITVGSSIDTTNLYITVINNSSSASAVNVYWVIYRDY